MPVAPRAPEPSSTSAEAGGRLVRPKEKFWLLLHKPEPELCVKHPGYDEDIMISTDSRTLTLVHMGRLPVADAERRGAWRVEGTPALVRGLPTWGGFYSIFAEVRSVI